MPDKPEAWALGMWVHRWHDAWACAQAIVISLPLDQDAQVAPDDLLMEGPEGFRRVVARGEITDRKARLLDMHPGRRVRHEIELVEQLVRRVHDAR